MLCQGSQSSRGHRRKQLLLLRNLVAEDGRDECLKGWQGCRVHTSLNTQNQLSGKGFYAVQIFFVSLIRCTVLCLNARLASLVESFFFVEFNLFIEIKTLSIICDIICFNFVHFTSVLKNSIQASTQKEPASIKVYSVFALKKLPK